MIIFLKWKIWRIEAALRSLLKEAKIKPHVWSFGAYFIHPKHLVFVVGVQTDIEKEKIKSDPDFNTAMKRLLVKFNWPEKARDNVVFDVESQETVNRENNGNWWYHYK
jgi:hypothetical protein